ncbi:hypothetical protein [Vibrio parahaemolyticus]|uniref:hypothetical protein n=1 Tax=Vibrio parahaemolyticus TaxID=670 RepID=UPI0009AAB826|nr:hypothetical protein [Vibrio parahaemolyticus]
MKSVQFRFTLYGCIAILSWSCLLGIARLVTESLGPVGGAAMLYSLSSIFLLIVVGIPKLSYFSPKYLIVGGNMVFLATLSYFTPIFSALFSSLILGVTLSNSFWQGVVMVTVGSLLCWLVTKEKREAAG